MEIPAEGTLMPKWILRLIYGLTLGALCLHLTTGTAVADAFIQVVQIRDSSLELTDLTEFVLLNNPAIQVTNPNVAELTLGVRCDLSTPCTGWVSFIMLARYVDLVSVTLDGSSSDTNASGYVDVEGNQQSWNVNGDGRLTMGPLNFSQTSDSSRWVTVDGMFAIQNLAPGASLSVSDPLTITVLEEGQTPEPGSAFLLIGGLAVVGFLRRKSRS